jgi:hypothetical protein
MSLRIDLRLTEMRRRHIVFREVFEIGNIGALGGSAVNMKRFIVLVLLTGLLVLSRPILAHHSAAEYDATKVVSVKGTVTQFEWSNPHAYIYLDVKDDKGDVEKWTVELASLGMLARANWRRDTVKPGDQITAFGNRAKDGRTVLRLEKVVFANGQELSARVL